MYSIWGIPIKINCSKEAIYTRIITLLKQLKFIHYLPSSEYSERPIVITISEKVKSITKSTKAEIYFRLCNIRAICKDDTVFFTNGHTVFEVHSKDGNAILYPEVGILSMQSPSLEQFFLTGLLGLLRWRELYALHSAGVSKDNLNILIMGNSGCGKSTVALSLIFQRWKFLSDDLLFIREHNRSINLFSTTTDLIFTPEIFHNHRNLVKLKKHVHSYSHDNHERVIDISTVYPNQVIRQFNPNVILFLKIVHQEKSYLVPITKRLALFKLINQSIFLFLGGPPSQKHLTALNKLALQSISFQLLMGRDLYKNPFEISDIISTIKLTP